MDINTRFNEALSIGYFFLIFLVSCQQDKGAQYSGKNWPSYLGDKSVSHYSRLDQISKENVHLLKQAWVYNGGHDSPKNRSQIQCNPLVIDGVLYGTSAALKLFALDAGTGRERWVFDPNKDSTLASGVNRGLVYWQNENEKRLFYASASHLFAINPDSGQLIKSFGDDGKINLKKQLGREVDDLYFSSNTPGIIYNDLYILGGRLSEGSGHIPGHIRAYDVVTGEMKWIFHTIPYPGEEGYDTWPENAYLKSGGANSWAGFSLDEKRGIVYAPTGSASFDFYGGDRLGSNLFANCIIALDAQTGKKLWHYQTVHHDIWDRDLPAPPNLVTIEKDGQEIDALVQLTKSGYLFVLDRVTGEPLYPIEEIEVPPSALKGEEAWPTQPVPTIYPPFSRVNVSEEDLAIRSEEARAFAKALWDKSIKGAQFLPPSEQGTIIFPGLDGAGEWGGAGLDPGSNTLYVNSNEVSWELKMLPTIESSPGAGVYQNNCQNCHGAKLQGSDMFGNVPPLTGIKDRLSREQITETILSGKGVMPSFKMLGEEKLKQVVDFLTGVEENTSSTQNDWPYPYRFAGYHKLLAHDRLSIFKPPWGQLTAIDLNHAKIKWQIPLGNIDTLDIPGHPVTGTENYGGPVVTAGGLVFIAATADSKIRAFDKDTGQQLWEAPLPAAGFATPATYSVDGIQYVVIACGGGKLGTKSGDSYVAFALGSG